MAKATPDTLERLLQLDLINVQLPKIGKDQWQILCSSSHEPSHRVGMWCALLDDEAAAKAIGHDSWDLSKGDSRPGFSRSWNNDKETTTYHRFGGTDGIRPFVLHRTFHGASAHYVEINEEFRLYHNLAEDKARGLLLDFDSSGREIEVARISPAGAQVRLKYLREFQAGTGLHLAVFVDSVRYSTIALADVPVNELERTSTDGMTRWRRNVVGCDFKAGYSTFSRLLSKVILEPPAREKAGVWPFKDDAPEEPVKFIIGIDSDGKDVEYTSDHNALANYFGANPGAPHYLTPIHFRREVLAKYFAEPERYEISDGLLTCLGLWSCQIDNDLKSRVGVFLGDLGRDLPYEERLHWRQFNVAPEGGLSKTSYRRSILAEFADAQAPDLAFRQEYATFMCDWERAQGWPLFLTPSPGDAHLLATVRIPVTNSQAELDEQIGHLSKLLVDSLNEKELAARGGVLEEGVKGITKMDGFLSKTNFPERQTVVQLLRDLQDLRSAGSAHRKGSAYDKISAKLGVDPTNKAGAVLRLLEEATEGLRALRLHYCKALEPPI